MASGSSRGGEHLFALDRVSKHYQASTALEDVSLAIDHGTTCALIGSSGSGKSTLLRLLLGLEQPDTGSVRVEGRVLAGEQVLALRRRVGYVIQEGGLFPHLSALGNLALLPRHLGWQGDRIVARAEQLAGEMHLPRDALDRYPAELSGGQRQRVALMRALMLDPDALLLDEPLGALDPVVRHDLQNELRRAFRELGKTVVLVTHDLAEAAWLADRLVLLRSGKIVQDGGIDDFRDRPANDFVRQFVAARRDLPPSSGAG